jgi:ankyrin repeat protein
VHTDASQLFLSNLEIFKLLVDSGTNLDIPNPKTGTTLLHTAVTERFTDAAKILVEKSNQLNSLDNQGNAPLHYAISKHNNSAVDLLIRANADLNVRNPKTQETLLHTAADCGNPYAVTKLLSKGDIDPNALDSDGYSPTGRALLKGHIDIPPLLENQGAKFDVNIEGSELINRTTESGHKVSIDFLVRHGVNINSYDPQGNIPVYYALAGEPDLFKYICSLGGDVNFQDSRGNSLLHNTVLAEDLSKIAILIKKGVNPYTKNLEGKSPLYDALNKNRGDIAKVIISSEHSTTLKNSIEAHEKDILALNCIEKAAIKGYESVIEFYVTLKDLCGLTPSLGNTVYKALYYNNYQCAEKLHYKLGATFNKQSQENINLLHHAVKMIG